MKIISWLARLVCASKCRPRYLLAALSGVVFSGAILAMSDSSTAAPRDNLPYANGKVFDTLEAYLEHLESLGPIGVPFYREVSPGRYVNQGSIRLGGQRPPTFSRQELARKYGFEK